jgi:hypothetical protein
MIKKKMNREDCCFKRNVKVSCIDRVSGLLRHVFRPQHGGSPLARGERIRIGLQFGKHTYSEMSFFGQMRNVPAPFIFFLLLVTHYPAATCPVCCVSSIPSQLSIFLCAPFLPTHLDFHPHPPTLHIFLICYFLSYTLQ